MSRIAIYKTLLDNDGQCVLVKEKQKNYDCECFSKPSNIVKMLDEIFLLSKQSEEYVYLLCFNNKLKLQGIFEISHGSVNSSVCSPREVYQKALLCNASYIAIAHNHPSGDCSPSMEDGNMWIKIKDAGQLIGITCVDSIVVGSGDYYSFQANKKEKKNE